MWSTVTIFVILIIIMVFLSIILRKPESKERYKKIFSISNIQDLRNHFVLDNPNGDGSDPTGGNVDYSYLFPKKHGEICKNCNHDTSWSEIPDNKKVEQCFFDQQDSFTLKLSKHLDKNGKVGSFRLSSKKLFRGGLFIADVEHIPVGCGVWPAFWLNGFVGAKDQYHMSPKDPNYSYNMKKLVKYTLGGKNNQNHTCKASESLLSKNNIDIFMSEYLKKKIYPAMWPLAGEIDIIEQTNFSPTNLVSIHGGPRCEVSSAYSSNYMMDWISPQYRQFGLRSVCGNTYEGLGPYSGCKSPLYQSGEKGISSIVNGFKRPNCPTKSAVNAGNSQIKGPYGSFGEVFNNNKGGVYAVQWIPKKKLNVWFYPRQLFSPSFLSKRHGPLGKKPKPKKWNHEEFPDQENVYLGKQKYKTLIASYILDDPNAMTEGCDFNFQALIINITLGGGWGGSSIPNYCSVDNINYNAQNYSLFLKKCYHENPSHANKKGVGKNGCYDGAMDENGRGSYAKPLFFSEAFFTFRSIRVFQNPKTDDHVW